MILGYAVLLLGSLVLFAVLRRRSMRLAVIAGTLFFVVTAGAFTYFLSHIEDTSSPYGSITLDRSAQILITRTQGEAGVAKVAHSLRDELDDRLSFGSPEAEVTGFLDSKGIGYEYDGKGRLRTKPIRHFQGTSTAPGSVVVTFTFDRDRDLVRYDISVTGGKP